MITGLGSAVDIASGKRGAFYYTLEEFHKYWDRIDIISPRISRGSTSGESSPEVEPLFGNVYIHVSPWPLMLHPIFFIKKALKLHKEHKFNLMTVQEFPPFYNGIGASIISVFTRIPYVLEIHHIPGYPKAANFKEILYRNLIKWFIKFDVLRATAVRVVNKKQTPEFLIKVGVPKEKIVYIPSMYIDLDIFKPMSLSKKYDLIFVGRLVGNKGVGLFIEAIRLLIVDYKLPVKCLIVGEGPLLKKIKLEIKNCPPAGRYGPPAGEAGKLKIDLYGRAKDSSEIARLLNESKIFLMPSYNEGGPRVVVEAMACGVPVLATNVGLMSDFADKNVVKIIDWNAKDIADKIKELLETEDERKKLSQAGLEIAKQFEKKEMIKNYSDKLKELTRTYAFGQARGKIEV